MENELKKYIQSYFELTEVEFEKINSLFKQSELKKGDYFLKSDKYSDKMGFIQAGIVREYFLADGKEITKWISTKGYFLVDLESFIFNKPSRWNLQALTDCQIFTINKTDYNNIGEIIPKWQELEKLFIAKCFTILEGRIVTHLSQTAEQRYSEFFNFAPELFNQIPLQYIASMLAMTPETLSRIRKKQTFKTS